MRRQLDSDRLIAALADRQWGMVTREQLLALGLSASAIDRRVRARRLLVIHRGVYAVGHRRVPPQGFRLAAVLACGEGAVLSDAAGAAHWALRPSAATLLDVTIPRVSALRRPGIRVHKRPSLATDEVTVHEAVPVTTPARTLLDLAATFPRRTVERALDRAEQLELFDLPALRAVIDAHRGRPGAPLLERILREHEVGSTLTRSELEERFLALCARAGLPRPWVNGRVAGLEVDFCWPGRLLVVEVDGYEFHRTRAAFERDRERDALLAAAGVRTLRFTSAQLGRRPREVLAALSAARSETS